MTLLRKTFRHCEELAEQGPWDSQFVHALVFQFHKKLALVGAGWAEEETRGGVHGTVEYISSLVTVDERRGRPCTSCGTYVDFVFSFVYH